MTGIWIVAFALQWVLLLLLAILTVGVLRYLSFVQNNIHLVTRYASRFEEGDRIGRFELSDLNGLPVLSKTLLNTSKKTLLFFLSTSCNGCDAVIHRLASLSKQNEGLKKYEWSFVLIFIGSRTSIEARVAQLPLGEITVLIDENGTLYQQYDIRTFPVTIAVDDQGSVMAQKLGDISNWLPDVLNGSSVSQGLHSLHSKQV
jgi:peroxiredoxin